MICNFYLQTINYQHRDGTQMSSKMDSSLADYRIFCSLFILTSNSDFASIFLKCLSSNSPDSIFSLSSVRTYRD